jgi:hypothetical protein
MDWQLRYSPEVVAILPVFYERLIKNELITWDKIWNIPSARDYNFLTVDPEMYKPRRLKDPEHI